MNASDDLNSEQVLILAPRGRDAALARALLGEAGIGGIVCIDIRSLCEGLLLGAACVLITEEAVQTGEAQSIAAWVQAQPPWSDLPFVVLTTHGGGSERNPAAAGLHGTLGNVSFLERPFHPTTLVSMVRSALRGRRRQYEARARLEELRESEAHFRLALRAGRLGSWELELPARILNASPACKAIFGRRPYEAFCFADLVESTHADDRAGVMDSLDRSFELGLPFQLEYRVLWPDGSTRWVSVGGRMVSDTKRIRMIGVCSEITARKTAERTLLEVNAELEARVAERAEALQRAYRQLMDEVAERERAEQQLRQAQKMEVVGQLTGGVAHDFNNLLMAVLGNLELVRKRLPPDPRLQRYVEGALMGAKRGAALTQRLLAFARRQDLHPEAVDLKALLNGMRPLLERSVGPLISLKVQAASGLPAAAADPNQLELAILNLAVNARDAMPDGGTVLLTIDEQSAEPGSQLAQGRYLRLCVRDTGIGMDAATLNRAIEPFFSTKELGKGTGLGLSMVHGLALQLGGDLRLSSVPRQGTTAELWLPIALGQGEPLPRPSVIPIVTVAALKVLVVDDDPLVAMSTSDMLEDLGHEVVMVNSGDEAFQLLRNGLEIDVLITDHAMPGMTGLQLARQTRDLRPELPILLATGYADLPQGAASDFARLAKPYQQTDLSSQLRELLTHRRAA